MILYRKAEPPGSVSHQRGRTTWMEKSSIPPMLSAYLPKAAIAMDLCIQIQPSMNQRLYDHREKEYKVTIQGVRNFLKDKSLLNMDMIFDRYPNEIYPFDYDTFFASNMKCEIVTTNCVTGKAEYMEEHSDRGTFDECFEPKASVCRWFHRW